MKPHHAAVFVVLLLLALMMCAMLAVTARAAAEPQQTELLQAALAACQAQTQDANARALERIATLTVQLAAAQKRVQELEAKQEPKK